MHWGQVLILEYFCMNCIPPILLKLLHRAQMCVLVGWLFGFYSISTFVDYLTQYPFYTNKQFYFKQFSLAWVDSLVVKNISISSYLV